MLVAGIYSLYIDRYLFWFPDWFLLSLEKGIGYDIPRYSFSLFQIPSFLIGLLGGGEYIRLKSVGTLLTLYPIVCLFFTWRNLRKGSHQFFIYPVLLCFVSFYLLTSAPSFNGALHAYPLFWLLFSLLNDNYNDKVKILFTPLYLLFFFFYPPASFTGSLILAITMRKRRDYNFYLVCLGVILGLAYLVFFKQFSNYPIYTETILGFKGTVFSPLALLFILINYFVFRFKYAGERKVYFHILLVIFLGFHLYENWNIFLLSNQYHYRIFLYTLGFLPALFANNDLGEKALEQKLVNSFAVFLVLVFLADIRASYLFQKDIDLLRNIASVEAGKTKCLDIPKLGGIASNYDDINSLSYLIPKINKHGVILMPEGSYTNALFKEKCNN